MRSHPKWSGRGPVVNTVRGLSAAKARDHPVSRNLIQKNFLCEQVSSGQELSVTRGSRDSLFLNRGVESLERRDVIRPVIRHSSPPQQTRSACAADRSPEKFWFMICCNFVAKSLFGGICFSWFEMHKSAALFLRAASTRRMPERIAEKVHVRITEFPVDPFGVLQLRVSDCSPKIVPLDHTKYPDSDRVVVSHCSGCDVERHQLDFVPTEQNDPKVVSISCTNGEHAEYCGCIIQVPTHLALDVSAKGDADVKISSLEPAECYISADYSSVHLHKIKTRTASIFANNGSVEVTGNLTGDISIKTGVGGFVRADRLQGSTVKIDTFEGSIACKAIYGKKVNLSSREGNIGVKNLQADEIKIWITHGNVDIGSLEGNLTASLGQGNLTATVAGTERVKVECLEGNVSLGTSSSLTPNYKLESPLAIETADDLAGIDEKQSTLETATNDKISPEIQLTARKGRIKLRKTSWMDSLNLGGAESAPALTRLKAKL